MNERIIKIRLVTVDLPENVHGSCQKAGDNEYNIMINSLLSDEDQEVTFLHEMLHIYHRDHDRGVNVDRLEAERHKMI